MFREIVGALLGNSAVKLFLVLYGWLAGLGLGLAELLVRDQSPDFATGAGLALFISVFFGGLLSYCLSIGILKAAQTALESLITPAKKLLRSLGASSELRSVLRSKKTFLWFVAVCIYVAPIALTALLCTAIMFSIDLLVGIYGAKAYALSLIVGGVFTAVCYGSLIYTIWMLSIRMGSLEKRSVLIQHPTVPVKPHIVYVNLQPNSPVDLALRNAERWVNRFGGVKVPVG